MTIETEWKDCPTMRSVVEAQERGDEIEVFLVSGWAPYENTWWNRDFEYRCRAKQPELVEVKMFCWLASEYRLMWFIEDASVSSDMIRQPHLDLIAKVRK